MTLLLLSFHNLTELPTGARSEKTNEPNREVRQDVAGDVDQFSTVLSKLDGEAVVASKRLPSLRSAELPCAKDEAAEHPRKADTVMSEETASAASPVVSYAVASPLSIDPNWSMLLTCASERVVGAPLGNGQETSDRSAEASAISDFDRNATTQNGVDMKQPRSFDEESAFSARLVWNGAPPLAVREHGLRLASSKDDGAPNNDRTQCVAHRLPGAPLARPASPASKDGDGKLPSAVTTIAGDTAPSKSAASLAEVEHERENSDDQCASETISGVEIQSLETHFPVVLSNMLVAQARQIFDLGDKEKPIVNIDIAPSTTVVDSRQPSTGAIKLLTIELEPASLGAVTVKMKMSRSGIDMQIRVESTEALRALDTTRDKLVDAMQSTGCAVDSCTIQVGAPPPTENSPPMTGDSNQNHASHGSDGGRRGQIGQEGQGHGGRGGDPRENTSRGVEEISSNVVSRRSRDRNGGLYL